MEPQPFDPDSYAREFSASGYSIHEAILSAAQVEKLRVAIASIPPSEEVRRKRNVYGVRNLLEICPAVRALAEKPEIRQFVTPVIGEGAFAVRAIFFDKVDGANWSLGWHQDSVISVAEKCDAPGFLGWSNKAGVWQVQPPQEILSRMIAVRVHLDDCRADNGPLRVITRTHKSGWLDHELDRWKERGPEVVCEVRSGGIVTMCPMALHASAPSNSVGHRRVIHIEFANEELPGGLQWNNRVGPGKLT